MIRFGKSKNNEGGNTDKGNIVSKEIEDRMRIIANLIIDRILEDLKTKKLKTKIMIESN